MRRTCSVRSRKTRSLCLSVAVLMALAGCASGPGPAAVESARLADREAIEATLERYTRGLDRLDAQLYLSSMTPDAVLMIYETAHRGQAALRQVIAEEARLRQTQRDAGQPARTLFHLEGNSSIEFTSALHAQHRAYWLTASRVGERPEGLTILGVGSSIDELEKVDGRWLITRREIRAQP